MACRAQRKEKHPTRSSDPHKRGSPQVPEGLAHRGLGTAAGRAACAERSPLTGAGAASLHAAACASVTACV